jgi:WD40 repeat protein
VDRNSTAHIWDVRSGRQSFELKAHSDRSTHAIFSPDGARLVTFPRGYRPGFPSVVPHVWDPRTGQEVALLRGHKERETIRSVSFSHDGTRIMTASSDETVRIWDASNGQQLLELQGTTAALSPDETRVVTTWRTIARIWDAGSGRPLVKLGGLIVDKSEVKSVAFASDGTRAATGSENGTARIWDMHSAESLVEMQGHTGEVLSIAFSPNGKKIATGGRDGNVRIWDATTGKSLLVLSNTSEVKSVAFNPGGTQIVTASHGGARVWKVNGSDDPLALHLDDKIASAVFSSDGKAIATAGEDGVARIWDAKTGNRLQELLGHEKALTSIAYSRDGSRLLTASEDGMTRIWDVKIGLLQKELRTRYEYLRKAAFSPNGRQVITVASRPSKEEFRGADEALANGGAIWIWDTDSGRPLGRLGTTEPFFGPYDAIFSPDGKAILIADVGSQPEVYICDVCGSIDELLATAKKRAPRDLTPEEITLFGL